MKRLDIGRVLVALVVFGFIFENLCLAWYYRPWEKGMPEQAGLTGEEAEREAGATSGSHAAGNGPASMLKLDPFIVNLFDERGVRYLKVRLDIELWDATEEEIQKKTPKIRDSLIVLLSSKKYEEIGSLEGKARLREEILFRLNRILGEGKAKEVYFTDFVVQ